MSFLPSITLHSITDPKFTGNCQRIRELDSLGLRSDAIVQEFRKQGIDISINMVNAVLNGEIEQMRRKSSTKICCAGEEKEYWPYYRIDYRLT